MSPPSQAPPELASTADELLHQCPRLRILVLGRTGAGKSALINRVFGVDVTTVKSDKPGHHDIDTALTSKDNDRFILHDSQGFESGEKDNLKIVLDFIKRRSDMPALRDQLHAIWLCIEILFANGRTFETGDEELLQNVDRKVPIIVVFTKLDVLYMRTLQELEEKEEAESMSDEEFDAAVVQSMDDKVQQLCVAPLRALQAQLEEQVEQETEQVEHSEQYLWAAVSGAF
ncbi:P-loop containing nucleoside triphosphate hydrolase protein [Amylostereum chailletii]|nr:P-loop containing nucleoside triphosphate hydrolase protein [Amylostereum chailletii]